MAEYACLPPAQGSVMLPRHLAGDGHRRGVTRGGGSVPGQALKMGVPVS